jgi:hypothetical protein
MRAITQDPPNPRQRLLRLPKFDRNDSGPFPIAKMAQDPGSMAHDRRLPTDVAQRHGQQRDANQQRPQTELKPAAFAFRQVTHHRIIHGRRRPEQEPLSTIKHVRYFAYVSPGKTGDPEKNWDFVTLRVTENDSVNIRILD